MPTRPPLAKFRLILWSLVLLIGIGASAFYLFKGSPPAPGLFDGPFDLASTEGGRFTDKDLAGTPSLIFFGYTFCPNVCPTTLAESTGWRQSLDLKPTDLRIIFVSVDPERDTVASMKSYLEGFGSPIIGLTGTDSDVENAKKIFGVYSEKIEDADSSDYLVNHTASVFLIDRDGKFEGTIAFGEARDAAIAKIKRLVGT